MALSTNRLILLVILQLCACAHVMSQDANQTTASTSATTAATSDSGEVDMSPINQALAPLYSMTDGFIGVVFPKGIRVDTIRKWIPFLSERCPLLIIWLENNYP